MYERKARLAEKNKLKLKQDSERESKEKMAEINRKYWDDFTKVLPEETFRIWNVSTIYTIFNNNSRYQTKLFTVIINYCKKGKKQLMKQVDYTMKMKNIRIYLINIYKLITS